MRRSVAHDAPEPARALMAAMLAAACDMAKLPAWFERHELQMTSPAARQVLWALGRRVTGNADLGFAFAERVPEDSIGSLWSLYQAAPSLRALSLAYNRWSALLLDFMEVQVVDEGSLTWFRWVARDSTVPDRAEQDYRAAMMVKAHRRLRAEPAFSPRAVHFTYAHPRTTRAHRLALGTDQLRFGQAYLQLSLSRLDADAGLPHAQPLLFAELSAAAARRAALPREVTLATRAEALITERLVHQASEATIARELGLSVRSLRRRLSEGGVTFRALVDRARRREGELLLEDSQVPIARVARLLGFASDRSMRNSMRRWHQKPGAIRRALAQASE